MTLYGFDWIVWSRTSAHWQNPCHTKRITEITKIQVSRLPVSKNVKGPFIVQVGSCDVYFRCHAMLHSCGNLVIFFSYSNYLHISVNQIFKLFFFLKMVKANKILNYLSTTASRLYVGATGLPNGFLRQKTSVFRFWCSLQLVDFSFFSIRFSVFVENNTKCPPQLIKYTKINYKPLK